MDNLATSIIEAKGNMNLRPCAREIGISPTTLTRAMRGHVPDQKTLAKICEWLGREQTEFTALGNLLQTAGKAHEISCVGLADHIMTANRLWIESGRQSVSH